MTRTQKRHVRLVNELMYEIKVHEAMANDVVTLPPTATFRELQQVMKEKKFSGVPIVDDGELVGMVSIDDLITAFDKDWVDAPVAEHMTRHVVSIPSNHSVISATSLFSKYRYGRLPVVEAAGSRRIVGIITYGDILTKLLMMVNSIAEDAEEQRMHHYRHPEGLHETLSFDIEADNFDLAGAASSSIKKYLKTQGVEPRLLRRIAVICYEAEINVVIHSFGGRMKMMLDDDKVTVEIEDDGPGIPDVDKALQEGFTTANEKIRALGFGAGMGLNNIRKCADEFDLTSSMEEGGTRLQAVVYLEQ